MSAEKQHTDSWQGKYFTEAEALQLVARGDQQAFAWLVRQYSDTLYSQCLAYTKSVQRTEELVQDIFLKVWAARERLPEIEQFQHWLFIVARNSIYKAFRARVKEAVEVSTSMADEDVLYTQGPDLTTEAREAYQLLLKGIEKLPEKRKQVFRMSRLEGLTHKEIASTLQIHEITVAQYIVKSLSFLKTYLQDQGVNTILMIILLKGR